MSELGEHATGPESLSRDDGVRRPARPLAMYSRFTTGIAAAAYVLAHPVLAWEWLRDPILLRRFRFIEHAASLALVSIASGFFRSVTLGVYVPLYGQWRMPLLDALSYYLIMLAWMVGVVLGAAWLIRLLSLHYGGRNEDTLCLGVAFFTFVPFLISGIICVVPFEIVRSFLALSVVYCGYLLTQGTLRLALVPRRAAPAFIATCLCSTYILARFSHMIVMGLLMPSYPALSPSSPPVSIDVIEFQQNLEKLADAFSKG